MPEKECNKCPVECNSRLEIGDLKETSAILQYIININYNRGQTIFLEGSKAKGIFCISRGRVKVFNQGLGGRDITVSLATDGDIIGFFSIANSDMYVHSAKCLEDSSICLLPYAVFKKLITEDNHFLNRMFLLSCSNYVHASQIINSLSCKSVRERIAFSIILLSEKFGIDNNGFINVRINREEVANLSGTITESAIRYLTEFKKENVILFLEKKIKILNKSKLHLIANSAPHSITRPIKGKIAI